MRYVGVKLPDNLYEEMVRRAREEGVTLSELVRRAVGSYLGRPATPGGSPEPSPADLQGLVGRVSELSSELASLREEVGRLSSSLHHLAERVAEIERRLPTPTQQPGSAVGSPSAGARPGSGRSKAWGILERDGVSCRSDMRKAKDPDAVIDKLLAEGAYAVSLEGDRCAVLPEAVEELLERLRGIRSSEPRVVEAQLEDRRLVRVFRALYGAGALYYNQEEGWALLEDALEKH